VADTTSATVSSAIEVSRTLWAQRIARSSFAAPPGSSAEAARAKSANRLTALCAREMLRMASVIRQHYSTLLPEVSDGHRTSGEFIMCSRMSFPIFLNGFVRVS
jgi:hypothetical protein